MAGSGYHSVQSDSRDRERGGGAVRASACAGQTARYRNPSVRTLVKVANALGVPIPPRRTKRTASTQEPAPQPWQRVSRRLFLCFCSSRRSPETRCRRCRGRPPFLLRVLVGSVAAVAVAQAKTAEWRGAGTT